MFSVRWLGVWFVSVLSLIQVMVRVRITVKFKVFSLSLVGRLCCVWSEISLNVQIVVSLGSVGSNS